MGKIFNIYQNDLDKAWYNSSNIIYSECKDYTNNLKELKITFKGGRTYRYDAVNVFDYLMFRESSSQGKDFNRLIKKYNGVRIDDVDLTLIGEELTREMDNAKLISLINKLTNDLKCAMVVSAFPSCRKTFMTNELNGHIKVKDSDSSTYDKTDFPKNYVNDIEKNRENYDILCVSSHLSVREELKSRNIPFVVFYPSIERKEECMEIYRKRGNDDKFIELLDKNFEIWINEIENDDSLIKIRLSKPNEFILDNNMIKKYIEICETLKKSIKKDVDGENISENKVDD